MRTVVWAIALLANLAVTGVVAVFVFAEGMPPIARLVALVLAVVAVATTVLLVLARSARLPTWGPAAMRVLCVAFPLLWLLGSLDHGMLSDQEVFSIVLVAALYWGTWRVFRSSSAAAV